MPEGGPAAPEDVPLDCEVAAVVVTMQRSPGLDRAIESVRAAAGRHDVAIVCVLNDPAAEGTWVENGIRYVGTGLNLGWAAGVHAGLIGVSSRYVWTVQDDLVFAPGALDPLVRALAEDDGLATVRPLRVDADGIVDTGSQGWYLDEHADGADQVPAEPTHADVYADERPGDFLLSSGQLVRRTAWDQVGGFDPWFFPWGFVDVDFGRTLTQAGWRFRTEPAARMRHDGGASTTSYLRRYLYFRNQSLFVQKWEHPAGPADGAPTVSPWIVEQARAARSAPRDVDLPALRAAVGAAATDITASMARWLPDEVLRQAQLDAAHRPSTLSGLAAKFRLRRG